MIEERFANHNQSKPDDLSGGRIYDILEFGRRLEGLPVEMHGVVGDWDLSQWTYPFSDEPLKERWMLYKGLFIGGFHVPRAVADWAFVLRIGEKNYYHWKGPTFDICPIGFEFRFGLFVKAPSRFSIHPSPGTPHPIQEKGVCEEGLPVILRGLFVREIC